MKKKSEMHYDEYAECMERMDFMHLMEHMIKLVSRTMRDIPLSFLPGT